MIFYYAHPAALYVNKFRLAGLVKDPINSYFEQIFETGVDEMSWDDMSKNDMEWPSVEAVRDYRQQVHAVVTQVIENHDGLNDGHPPIGIDHPLWALFMGFEHERIHVETSSVLIREMPLSLVKRPDRWPPLSDRSEKVSPNEFVPYGQTEVSIGRNLSDIPEAWGWDNEFGRRQASVPEFSATRCLISNQEYYDFVVDGGYVEQAYWSEEGWRWRRYRNAKWPSFWVPDGPAGLHQYKLRTCFEVIDMPWSWPVIANYHEAKAYGAWRAKKDRSDVPYRLLTEAEHHVLWRATLTAGEVPATSNLDLRHGSEGPVDDAVFGNVWQWCEDDFHPLSGFQIHKLYDDFSTPCFDGKHQMILGGSFISTGDEAGWWARFHFRPHFIQQAGFRMVRAPSGDGAVVKLGQTSESNRYDRRDILSQYLLLHFGSQDETIPYPFAPSEAARFPSRCADLVVQTCRRLGIPTNRALDVGCAVGGASFRMAEAFSEVLGIDLSTNFIEAARTLKTEGEISYQRTDEGEITTPLIAKVAPIARDRVSFRQADACSLPADLVNFDAVLMANLLCRIPSPKSCLSRMGGPRGIVRRGGILVITTPFTWSEEFTPKAVWLGGVVESGSPQRSEDGLKACLEEEFELIERREEACLIREHARKYEYIVPLVTVWRRK
jgi:5-histidylcysteine sulfoxide synthase/putative 4-mercaptohistidine N1-methyltranferase